MTAWEQENDVKIPESYKEWLRFSRKCRIMSNTATFWGPDEFNSMYVPKNLIVIGEIIGDGEMVCFDSTSGNLATFFEGKVSGEFSSFSEILKRIISVRSGCSGFSEDGMKKIMEMVLKYRENK